MVLVKELVLITHRVTYGVYEYLLFPLLYSSLMTGLIDVDTIMCSSSSEVITGTLQIG